MNWSFRSSVHNETEIKVASLAVSRRSRKPFALFGNYIAGSSYSIDWGIVDCHYEPGWKLGHTALSSVKIFIWCVMHCEDSAWQFLRFLSLELSRIDGRAYGRICVWNEPQSSQNTSSLQKSLGNSHVVQFYTLYPNGLTDLFRTLWSRQQSCFHMKFSNRRNKGRQSPGARGLRLVEGARKWIGAGPLWKLVPRPLNCSYAIVATDNERQFIYSKFIHQSALRYLLVLCVPSKFGASK